jgi:hypothetical protein
LRGIGSAAGSAQAHPFLDAARIAYTHAAEVAFLAAALVVFLAAVGAVPKFRTMNRRGAVNAH